MMPRRPLLKSYSYNNSNLGNNPRRKSCNSFVPLQKYDVEFHKCNNYRHITRLCMSVGISKKTDGTINKYHGFRKPCT